MLLILSVWIGMSAYAQNKFEKGYYINNSGQKVECLIQNDDWLSNPSNFKYKISETSTVETGNFANTQEFGIIGKSKYQKFTVDIDRSSNKIKELSTKRTAEFKTETLFLKVLVEGSKANLYSYIDNSLRRYFYKKPNGKVTQLVYKQYRSSNQGLRKNESYKSQLKSEFPCDEANSSPSYTKSSLVKYFVSYNNCDTKDAKLTNFTLSETKGKFRFKVKAGLNYTKTFVTSLGAFGDPEYDTDFQANPRFGFEVEYVLPSNNNRWSVFIEPSYQSFEADAKRTEPTFANIVQTFLVEYQSLEIPIGIRHYIPVGIESSRLFLNAGVTIDMPMGDSQIVTREISSDIDVFFGAGYELRKFNVEARYYTGRGLLDNPGLEATYSGFAFVLGYTLF